MLVKNFRKAYHRWSEMTWQPNGGRLYCGISRKTLTVSSYNSLNGLMSPTWWRNSIKWHQAGRKKHPVSQYINLFDTFNNWFYTLSNVTVVDEKLTYCRQYLRYCHQSGTNVFSMPSAIKWAYHHFARTISHRVGIFEHAIMLEMAFTAGSAGHLKNK